MKLNVSQFYDMTRFPDAGSRCLVMRAKDNLLFEAIWDGSTFQTPAGKPLYSSELGGWMFFPELES